VLSGLIAFAVFLAMAVPAFGATVTDRPLLFTFNGSDTTLGTIQELREGLAVDEATGSVYALDLKNGVIVKFDSEGHAANFSATGSSSLDGSETPGDAFNFVSEARVAVDNSAVNPGRIYVANGGFVDAFSSAGTFLWRLSTGVSGGACGVAVDAEGHLWLGDSNSDIVREYAAAGSPPAEVSSFAADNPCALDVDVNGDVYVLSNNTLNKYIGGVVASTVDTGVRDFTVDDSSATGHIFTVHSTGSEDSFNEFDSSGTPVGTFGAGVLYESQNIAYNGALDRVYVGQFVFPGDPVKTGTIKAFGSVTTGTVPDGSAESVTEVGVSRATFNATINPQSVPNSYFVEWKEGEAGFQWRRAKASVPQPLTADSADHTVSVDIPGLRGGATYQARLVLLNTDSGLRNVLNPVTFTTAIAASPTATIAEPTAVTTTSAQISGTVNPQTDFGTTWHVQTSIEPDCASDFTDGQVQQLESEASSPVAVSEELTGLLPSQHYCVRISATNSGGTTDSEVREFETQPVAPSQVETIAPAPRLDTQAQLNARVNPEGDVLNYHFEYSADGGATWNALPGQLDTSESHLRKVIAQQLTGLTPGTSYAYRVIVENSAGETQSAPITFTTRSSAEVTLPTRGYELVNTPDKGNQNVAALGSFMGDSPLSADGESVVWDVTGGAPGGTNGTGATFLAERTPTGWRSRSLFPSAEEQIGGGGLTYKVAAADDELSTFSGWAARSVILGSVGEISFWNLDAHQNQTVLATYETETDRENVDMTTDGRHLLLINPETQQLEDIGVGSRSVVSIMPDGTESSCGLTADGVSFTGGAVTGSTSASGRQWRPGYHMMSTRDASVVYFQVQPNGECSKQLGIYARDRATEETTLVDPGTINVSPEFIRATPDGKRAYFLTRSQLDSADSNPTKDLYVWDEEARKATCLTCVVPEAAVGEGISFSPSTNVIVSDDFSSTYFASKKLLVPGKGQAGATNVYRLHDGSLQFVAAAEQVELGPNARSSADGEVLVFDAVTEIGMTADEVAEECPSLFPGDSKTFPCQELYRYEAGEESLECVSCARGSLTMESIGTPVNGIIGRQLSDYRLSDDGSTVAFVTRQRLLAADVNRTTDVYEWRNGSLQLITDGVTDFQEGVAAPQVRAIDEQGENILFLAAVPNLTGYEQDGLTNLYDARVGGGFERPTTVGHCSEESCQDPLLPPPAPSPQSSAAFAGNGNVGKRAQRRRCRKGRTRRGNRCINRNKASRRHARPVDRKRPKNRAQNASSRGAK
jgi:sugar lactone lactonase YvrE